MKNENTIQMQEVVPWLIFKLKKTLYTVNSKFITSIVIKPDDVTFVPNVADHIIGLIHLRGNVIPLIDLKLLLNTESESISNSTDYSKEIRPMVVVLEIRGLLQSLASRLFVQHQQWVKQMCNNGFITGVAKGHKSEEVLLVIDEEKIMSNA
jgi:purine-binding chemotaxis protein CheW